MVVVTKTFDDDTQFNSFMKYYCAAADWLGERYGPLSKSIWRTVGNLSVYEGLTKDEQILYTNWYNVKHIFKKAVGPIEYELRDVNCIGQAWNDQVSIFRIDRITNDVLFEDVMVVLPDEYDAITFRLCV